MTGRKRHDLQPLQPAVAVEDADNCGCPRHPQRRVATGLQLNGLAAQERKELIIEVTATTPIRHLIGVPDDLDHVDLVGPNVVRDLRDDRLSQALLEAGWYLGSSRTEVEASCLRQSDDWRLVDKLLHSVQTDAEILELLHDLGLLYLPRQRPQPREILLEGDDLLLYVGVTILEHSRCCSLKLADHLDVDIQAHHVLLVLHQLDDFGAEHAAGDDEENQEHHEHLDTHVGGDLGVLAVVPTHGDHPGRGSRARHWTRRQAGCRRRSAVRSAAPCPEPRRAPRGASASPVACRRWRPARP